MRELSSVSTLVSCATCMHQHGQQIREIRENMKQGRLDRIGRIGRIGSAVAFPLTKFTWQEAGGGHTIFRSVEVQLLFFFYYTPPESRPHPSLTCMQRMREVMGSRVPLIGGVIAQSYRRDAVGRVVVEDGLGHLPFLFALFSSCVRIKTSRPSRCARSARTGLRSPSNARACVHSSHGAARSKRV